MPANRPPTIDPVAAARWAHRTQDDSAWLHEEVARRMAERLQWIRLQPAAWADWEPIRGGIAAHAEMARRYPKAASFVVEPNPQREQAAQQALRRTWWKRLNSASPAPRFEAPPDGAVQMVWANMLLHMAPDPQSLMAQWHRALAPDGFLMFSGLGPDSLVEVRSLYRELGWPPPSHEFTDMHDWGDMLVNAGFAEPVMDMERITLTFDSANRLLRELRQLGRNLHPMRFPALRGRDWRDRLAQELSIPVASEAPRQLQLTFEIIYGHALRPRNRLRVQNETVLTLDEMREALQQRKDARDKRP